MPAQKVIFRARDMKLQGIKYTVFLPICKSMAIAGNVLLVVQPYVSLRFTLRRWRHLARIGYRPSKHWQYLLGNLNCE